MYLTCITRLHDDRSVIKRFTYNRRPTVINTQAKRLHILMDTYILCAMWLQLKMEFVLKTEFNIFN